MRWTLRAYAARKASRRAEIANMGESKYWAVSKQQLARDLKPRTLKAIYSENRRGRDPLAGAYVPRFDLNNRYGGGGLDVTLYPATLKAEYLAWCKARGHKPHPASLDWTKYDAMVPREAP